jgi:uncharacterized protein YceH (UPF0502 family)
MKVNVSFTYNDETEQGQKLSEWLLLPEVQKNVSKAIRDRLFPEDEKPGLEERVAVLEEEVSELKKTLDSNGIYL